MQPALASSAAPSQPAADALPTMAEIQAVIAMNEPILRNLWITHTYHGLDLALARHFGGAHLSWCAYGTWASKSAGRFIRGEVVWPLLQGLFGRRTPALAGWLTRVDAEVRRHTAEGNHRVFTELAPLFRALVDALDAPADERAPRIAALVDALRPGASEDGGQDALRRAFARYHEAALARDPKVQAELVLLANALVGYHEQIRLQAPIEAALRSPAALLVEIEALPLRRLLGDRIAQGLRGLMTRWLMTLELPEASIRLGDNVPCLADGAMFPRELAAIDNPELLALLRVLDRTPDTLAGSAANDWGRLEDRMNYIVDLFRSRQRDVTLRRPPFTARQVAAIRDHHCPYGPL
ncbi:MAG: hypothetical protein R3B09_27725 [Nannocystaceae bacterium]